MTRERIYTGLATGLPLLQFFVPVFLTGEIADMATTIIVTLVAIFTLKKQRISIEVNNNAKKLTWVLIGIASLGGINDIIGFIHFNPTLQTSLRNAIAGLLALLNVMSKNLFPTEEGKLIQDVRHELKQLDTIKEEN